MGPGSPGPGGRRLTEPAEPAATAGDPVRAWRYWLLSPAGRLRSVSQRWIEWPTDRPMTATCLGGGHRAPDPGCACGIYGSPSFEALRDHGLCVVPSALVVGEVDLWGRIVADDDGLRGQSARPARLALVPETAEVDRVPVATTLDTLAAYGVPVSTMALDEAVAGITAAMLQNQLMASRASRPAGS